MLQTLCNELLFSIFSFIVDIRWDYFLVGTNDHYRKLPYLYQRQKMVESLRSDPRLNCIRCLFDFRFHCTPHRHIAVRRDPSSLYYKHWKYKDFGKMSTRTHFETGQTTILYYLVYHDETYIIQSINGHYVIEDCFLVS